MSVIHRLLKCIEYDDISCESYIISKLQKNKYTIIRKDNMYIFGIPPGDKIIPVLLCAHWDTKRLPEIPVSLEIGKNGDAVTNSCGILGADDRAGVQAILEVCNIYNQMPYVLFTNYEETGMTGMVEFINSGVLWDYENNINLIISVDRMGDNELVSSLHSHIPDEVIPIALSCGYMPGNGWVTDSYLLEKEFNIAAINVSIGFYNQHSKNEYLSIEDWQSSVHRLSIFMCNIHNRHTAHPRKIEYSSVHYPTKNDHIYIDDMHVFVGAIPECYICGRNDRDAKYDPEVEVHICYSCKNRAYNSAINITKDSINLLKHKLELERQQTRKANSLMRNNMKHKLPPCPVCGSIDHITYNRDEEYYICNSCNDYFYKFPATFDGRFWKIWNNTLKEKQVLWISGVFSFRKSMKNNAPVIMDYVHKDNAFVTCAHCGEYVRKHYDVEVQFKKETKLIHLCPCCLFNAQRLLVEPPIVDVAWEAHFKNVTQGSEDASVPF